MRTYNTNAIRSIAAAVVEILRNENYRIAPIVVMNNDTLEAFVQSSMSPVNNNETIIYNANRVTPDWLGDLSTDDVDVDDVMPMILDEIAQEDWEELVRD